MEKLTAHVKYVHKFYVRFPDEHRTFNALIQDDCPDGQIIIGNKKYATIKEGADRVARHLSYSTNKPATIYCSSDTFYFLMEELEAIGWKKYTPTPTELDTKDTETVP